jgi:hypothetical protein
MFDYENDPEGAFETFTVQRLVNVRNSTNNFVLPEEL